MILSYKNNGFLLLGIIPISHDHIENDSISSNTLVTTTIAT